MVFIVTFIYRYIQTMTEMRDIITGCNIKYVNLASQVWVLILLIIKTHIFMQKMFVINVQYIPFHHYHIYPTVYWHAITYRPTRFHIMNTKLSELSLL